MSVRKGAARASVPSGGAGLLKSLGFWALLAGASFIVGLFILSPLINKANEGARASAPAASSGGPAPAPTPTAGLNTGSAPRDARQAEDRRRTDSDVQITPDAAADGGVQKPSTVDDPAQAEYRERRAQIERRLGSEGAGRQATDAPSASDAPDASAQPSDALDRAGQTGRSGDVAASSADTDTRPRRRRRHSRDTAPSGDTATPAGPRDATAPAPATGGTDVQKGDTIDR